MKLTIQQQAIVDSTARRIVVAGGRMSGKTTTAIKRAESCIELGGSVAYLVQYPRLCKLFRCLTNYDIHFVHNIRELEGNQWHGIVVEDFCETRYSLLQLEALTCWRRGWILVQGVVDPEGNNYPLFRSLFANQSYEAHTLNSLCTREMFDKIKQESGELHFRSHYLNIWPADPS